MVNKHTSENGLRFIWEKIPNVRTVTIGIWILAGSRNETIHTNGISHFIEHMLFKGTKTRTAQDIAKAFDSIGGQVNAFTSKECTCVYARVLDTYKEYTVEILADMFFNSIFDEEEIAREKKVVVEEIKMYDDTPDDAIHDLLAQATYGKHPLAYPILGTEQHLDHFTDETIYTYMKEQYIPENIVISIVGNVDESFIRVTEDYFNKLKPTVKKRNIDRPILLANNLSRKKDIEQAHLCLGFNGRSIGDSDTYCLAIVNNVLGGSMSSRLFQEVRETQGLAYDVYSYHTSYLDSGLLTIYAGTGIDQLKQLENTLMTTIEDFLDKGLTDEELSNSKEQLKGSLVLSLESPSSRMFSNAKNELLLNHHPTIDEMMNEIDLVSQDSAYRLIKSIFNQNPSVALISP